jgi:hypothetical protein
MSRTTEQINKVDDDIIVVKKQTKKKRMVVDPVEAVETEEEVLKRAEEIKKKRAERTREETIKIYFLELKENTIDEQEEVLKSYMAEYEKELAEELERVKERFEKERERKIKWFQELKEGKRDDEFMKRSEDRYELSQRIPVKKQKVVKELNEDDPEPKEKKQYARPSIDRKQYAKHFFGDDLELRAFYRDTSHTIRYREETDDFVNIAGVDEEDTVYESLSKAVQSLAKATGRKEHYPNAWKTYKAYVDGKYIDVDRLDLVKDVDVLKSLKKK